MTRFLYTVIFTLSVSSAVAQDTKDFDVAIGKFQSFMNTNQADSIYNMMSDKGKTLLPHDKAIQAFTGLHLQCGDLKSYEFKKLDNGLASYKVSFDKVVLKLSIALSKENKLETFHFAPYKEESEKEKSNFKIPAGSDFIYGTITTPSADKKVPVVLIISGSGPTDRDCNNPLGTKSNSFKMLADSLNKTGIATLRYDKRGVGESAAAVKDEANETFDDLVTDAINCIKYLKADNRFSEVFVMGHSEGSLIGILAAGKETVAGVISLSGAGQGLDQLIELQITAQSAELGKHTHTIIDSIKHGYTVKNIPDDLVTVFHTSVQPYLRSCFMHNPQTEIKKLTCPALIVQGTTDIQISEKDARLLKTAYPKSRLTIVKGMNHVLKQAPSDRNENLATYNMPDLPLSPGFVPEIIKFVNTKK